MGGMNAAEIIDALGGTSEVATVIGTSPSAVSNMKVRGLPRSRLLDLYGMALQKRPDITIEMIRAAATHGEAA